MAYAKKPRSRSEFGIKKPRTPVSAYTYAVTARNVILTVIVITTFIVCATILLTFFLDPARQVESKINSLATNYYEKVFYEDLNINNPNDAATALEKYQTTGLSTVTLRQLLLSDVGKNTNDADYLLKYCDAEATRVKFYPDPPFTRTSYHIEYTYSCNF